MLFYLLAVLGLVPTFQKTKCKRLLNLTMERIKLLEKRRQARLRQLHRDVIELLQLNKQDKVDPWLLRISKERCLFFVYIKIAEYCGFVQSNLKDIAGQRECPSGLQEPLAGLCFAASCCADLPELQELREIFAMKYGKQIVSSAQDLKPNHHVNQQFLDNLCAKDPSDTEKQSLLEEITTNLKEMHGHEQDTQQQDIHNSLSSESLVDLNEYNQPQERIDHTMIESEDKDQSGSEELPEVNVVQEANHVETVCNEDLRSVELANEQANRKRSLEDRPETRHSALKRPYRWKIFWQNKAMGGEEKRGKEHVQTVEKVRDSQAEVCSDTERRLAGVHNDGCEGSGVVQVEGITAHLNEDAAPDEDQRILQYVEQAPSSHPPQRCPPAPPPRRAPPPLPPLRAISMPRSHNDKQVNANTSHPLHCSTMASNYYLETYGSHVHPRLPNYEDLVANFTALKR